MGCKGPKRLVRQVILVLRVLEAHLVLQVPLAHQVLLVSLARLVLLVLRVLRVLLVTWPRLTLHAFYGHCTRPVHWILFICSS